MMAIQHPTMKTHRNKTVCHVCAKKTKGIDPAKSQISSIPKEETMILFLAPKLECGH